jgi:hypothetical protein
MKNFCALMYIIIQNMLQYYITNITNVNPLKPKVMKLACTWKTTFNINDTTIHYIIAIPLNQKKKLEALNDD